MNVLYFVTGKTEISVELIKGVYNQPLHNDGDQRNVCTYL